ncbi:SAM-dependent RNA methyltransferase [Mycena rebaudengoi]|nr:SAM-dependent RNA methyltransferase [Mycena rebaudengoi]
MEDDDESTKTIPPWIELEYAQMRILAGPNAQIHFTHLPSASREAFLVLDLINERIHGAPVLDKVCLLDPKAEHALSPEDGDRFEWFLFGGILGDDPSRDRTSELRALGFPTRHLGPVQMTTDTALCVTKMVVDDKGKLYRLSRRPSNLCQFHWDKIPYVEFPTAVFNPMESVEMPFRYITEGTEPKLPPGMRELLDEDLNKSFDF